MGIIDINKEYIAGNSITTRRELEELPCPICTLYCTDDEFQRLVNLVYSTSMHVLGLECGEYIDFDDEYHSEVWWATLEEVATQVFDMPYYEDMTDDEYAKVKEFYNYEAYNIHQ